MSERQKLRQHFVGRGPLFDLRDTARAEAALAALGDQFVEWLDGDVERVCRARAHAQDLGWHDASLEALHAAAHDLKGMGATYDFPLASRIAASLCRLIGTDEGKTAARAQPALVEAHVEALRASVRDQVRTVDASPVVGQLVAALEARVSALGVAPV